VFVASPLLAKYGINAVFSDSEGGCSPYPFASLNLGLGLGDDKAHVEENLTILCQKSEIQPPHQVQQVHGAKALYCTGKGQMHDVEADILLATDKGVSLAVRTADCLPMLLVDPQAKVIAAVHAGWRGTVAKAAAIAVREMCLLGAAPERILASLGACIGSCCFAINDDVGNQLSGSCGEDVVHSQDGKLYADLAMTNRLQLMHEGVQASHIESMGACTCCSLAPLFFSYRREHGQTGRQLAIISL